MPVITPSGTFNKNNKLVKHTKLIAIDIDLNQNEQVKDFHQLKLEISKLEFVAYCGYSVSGKNNGLWCIIPIAYPDKHKQHFRALKNDFKSYGIIIDDSCKNVNRLRYASYDDEAYFNHEALVYTKHEKQQTYKHPVTSRQNSTNVIDNYNSSAEGVTEMIRSLESAGWIRLKDGDFRRPGKKTGKSATIGKVGAQVDVFNVMTPNAPPLECRGYNAAQIMAELEFNGNYTACWKHLHERFPEVDIKARRENENAIMQQIKRNK